MVDTIIEGFKSDLERAALDGKRVSVGFYSFDERVASKYVVGADEIEFTNDEIIINSGYFEFSFQYGNEVRVDKNIGIDVEYGFINNDLCLYLCILGTF